MNQKFKFNANNSHIEIFNGGLCVEAGADNMVIQNTCNETKVNQKWQYSPSDLTIRPFNDNSLCLDLKSGVVSNGTNVVVFGCHNWPTQQWSFHWPCYKYVVLFVNKINIELMT